MYQSCLGSASERKHLLYKQIDSFSCLWQEQFRYPVLVSLYLSVNLYLIQFVTWGRSKRICCRLIAAGELLAQAGLFPSSEPGPDHYSDSEPLGQLDLNRRAVNKKVKI